MANGSCVLFFCIWIYTFCHFPLAATGQQTNNQVFSPPGATTSNSSSHTNVQSPPKPSTPSQPPQPSTPQQVRDMIKQLQSPPPQTPINLLNTSSGGKRGRIVGVIFLSFAGVLQLGIAIFLIIRRRRILDDVNGLQIHRFSLRLRSCKPSTA
ncbi:hypothetical protein KP509_13G018500 [Ceratopteris richardii]|uniref:Uncharacterized protein n=1 Tax=Ceratopteris richardii TaxID=49495 RepID=A0A8T2TFV4_CERRI|nr:hypothetical protein KP509_13G018500 [Ceratopteris richardii]